MHANSQNYGTRLSPKSPGGIELRGIISQAKARHVPTVYVNHVFWPNVTALSPALGTVARTDVDARAAATSQHQAAKHGVDNPHVATTVLPQNKPLRPAGMFNIARDPVSRYVSEYNYLMWGPRPKARMHQRQRELQDLLGTDAPPNLDQFVSRTLAKYVCTPTPRTRCCCASGASC